MDSNHELDMFLKSHNLLIQIRVDRNISILGRHGSILHFLKAAEPRHFLKTNAARSTPNPTKYHAGSGLATNATPCGLTPVNSGVTTPVLVSS